MSRYLYGASVQGIQEFVFATNRLQEIVGASEIVKRIAKSFEDFVKDMDVEVLVNAAGNIKARFNDEEACKKTVHAFARSLQENAYGITVSQAVVKLEGETAKMNDALELLEKRLKMQRNRPALPLDAALSILEQSPRTARPTVGYRNNEPLDRATMQKRDAYTQWFSEAQKEDSSIRELKEISALSNGKNKVAVIHADGNGLGSLVKALGDRLSDFSVQLDKATKNAFASAKQDTAKIREIVLGGDDLTVICDASEALGFTQRFLAAFEEESAQMPSLKGLRKKLTACAGIAYCNEKYPFHYAVSLAEALCSQAKSHAKQIDAVMAPSCLMFHNVQSASFQSWQKLLDDELTIESNDGQKVMCDFGPYYIDAPKQPHIDNLVKVFESYRCEGSPLSKLRRWMSELHRERASAEAMLARINEVVQESGKWHCSIMERNLESLYEGLSNERLIVEKDGTYKTPVYDILQLNSVMEGK